MGSNSFRVGWAHPSPPLAPPLLSPSKPPADKHKLSPGKRPADNIVSISLVHDEPDRKKGRKEKWRKRRNRKYPITLDLCSNQSHRIEKWKKTKEKKKKAQKKNTFTYKQHIEDNGYYWGTRKNNQTYWSDFLREKMTKLFFGKIEFKLSLNTQVNQSDIGFDRIL